MGISKVTAVVPSYGHAGYIGKTLESLLGQQEPPRAIVVVNDGSPDDTDAAVGPYLNRITYLRQFHQGLAHAVLNGLSLVETEYVHFIASDDWLEPTALQVLSRVLDSDPEIGVAHGWRVVEDGDSSHLNGPPLVGKHHNLKLVLSGEYIYATPSILWRTAAVRQVQEALNLSFALDYARWMAVLLEGWHCYAVPNVLGHYRRHARNSSRQANYSLVSLEELRALRFILRHYRHRMTHRQLATLRVNIHGHYRDRAWQDLRAGRAERARRRFAHHLRHSPGRFNSIVGWGAASLPRPVYYWLRALGPVR